MKILPGGKVAQPTQQHMLILPGKSATVSQPYTIEARRDSVTAANLRLGGARCRS
jgi:hypothetical protein